jgi:carbonic anhydrase
MVPRLGWAIVTCMDTRLDIGSMFPGVGPGDAHVIRNAGGVVTDDTIRSLAISQRYGHTRAIYLVHHTDCALQRITGDEFEQQLTLDSGVRPRWKAGAFTDPNDAIRRSLARVEASPFIPYKDDLRGYVYDVTRGRLDEVHRHPVTPEIAPVSETTPWHGSW